VWALVCVSVLCGWMWCECGNGSVCTRVCVCVHVCVSHCERGDVPSRSYANNAKKIMCVCVQCYKIPRCPKFAELFQPASSWQCYEQLLSRKNPL
jgi:hypothetical protein